jgi:polyisoprenoid-binding protein YceI
MPIGIHHAFVSKPRPGSVFTITPEESDVKFFVKASVAIDGKFKKWESTLTFTSTDPESGVLDIKI